MVTTAIPPSFTALQDPGLVKVNHDLNALSIYYNTTLTQIGAGNFANASFLLETFRFVNIPPAVNATAQLANSDLATVNSTSANATVLFQQAAAAINAKQYVNATILVNQGCAFAQQANKSLADFLGTQTTSFKGQSVPVAQYGKGLAAARAEVKSLTDECSTYKKQLEFSGLVLLIGSPQTSIETGGTVRLTGNLTFKGSPVANDEVFFYINGSYFGSLTTTATGGLSGTLTIPFIYSHTATVQALAKPNLALNLGGASSNTLVFIILFNQTTIVVGDPPAVLPTFSFNVEGNLSTVSGTPLPDAPVKVTFFKESRVLYTDSAGIFATRLTVPANATDGIYNVYASFAPQGVFGPSFNFTSIEVVHLPMNISVFAPSLTLAGFSTALTGRATSNGTDVAGANITVNSPWGVLSSVTNSSGGFTVSVPVSPLEFAFSRPVNITATAPQPYFAQAYASKAVGLFNILAVVLPVAAIGLIGYEADKLGAFDGLKRRPKPEEAWMKEFLAEPEQVPTRTEFAGGSELLQTYRLALILASKKLKVRFRSSQTLREMVDAVRAKESGPASDAFGEIMSATEDFLYAEAFDVTRLASAKARLVDLEGYWK